MKYVWVIRLRKPVPKESLFAINSPTMPKNMVGKYIFLNEGGGFTPFGQNTWIFLSKKKAQDYSSDIYDWGCLKDYVEYVRCKVEL